MSNPFDNMAGPDEAERERAEREQQARDDRRAREVERASGRGTSTLRYFTTKVVGVSFTPDYPDNLLALQAIELQGLFLGATGESLPALLIREPENEHDPNAVAVHVPAINAVIGHIPRALAARLAPSMDAGQEWKAELTSVQVHSEHPDRPGIGVAVTRIDEWER